MMNSDVLARVFLVGAGPGDPGLITVRGAQLLASADVVVYDALANPLLLSHCKPQAEKIYVGKREAAHALPQEKINQLLVEKARAGHHVVVRLKGGDPFVFGRGGEECETLAEAGIGFEVVPGITAAIAAPAYAGIPITHRDFNSSFTFVTGHEKEEEYKQDESRAREPGAASDIDWSVLARLPCLAFYMGVKSLPRICAKLLEHGMAPSTPAATIRWGTMPMQQSVVGTLADLPQRVSDASLRPPALTIIGRVVSLRPALNWFERRPLFGKTVVVTRTRQQASELSQRLGELGANVIEAPTIELAPPEDWSAVDAALGRIASYDWVVFTSANGVRAVKQRLLETGRDARAFADAKIAAIGDATAAAVRDELCLACALCPASFVAEALADALESAGVVRGGRFLLLRADIARPLLRERLESGGAAEVLDLPVYETRSVSALPEELIGALAEGRVDWITFTSSSTARNLIGLLGADYRDKLRSVRLASIGPVTTRTLEAMGLAPHVQARVFTIDGLVDALVEAAGIDAH